MSKAKKDADALLALGIKRRKPGGRPFEKGNKVGPRFAPGESGNPSGRPSGLGLLGEAYRKILKLEVGTFKPHSYAEAIALEIIKKAARGNVQAASEIGDRTEGKPRQAYDVELSVNDELAEIVEKARKRAAK